MEITTLTNTQILTRNKRHDQQITNDLKFLNDMFDNVELWNSIDNDKNLLFKMTSLSGLTHGYITILNRNGFKIYGIFLKSPIQNPQTSICEILLVKKLK